MTRKRRLAVSMGDVAAQAGVSIATVSHVINKTRPVSDATERAVIEAIGLTGYVPDNTTALARPDNTRILGIAISSLSNTYFNDLLSVIEQSAEKYGFSLLLADTQDDVASEIRAVSRLLSHRVDAIILAASPDPTIAVRQAEHAGVPVILIDRFVDLDLDQVGVENVESTGRLVDELVRHGHTRIAFIGGRQGLATSTEREEGFRRGLTRNGMKVEPQYLVSGDSDAEVARGAFLDLMKLPEPPSAVVVANNNMTVGTLRGAHEAGLDVPRDVAVVAFDDFDWADLFHPRLTVMAQPLSAIADQAVHLVVSRLANPDLPARRMVIQAQFMHRESCGCIDKNARPAFAR